MERRNRDWLIGYLTQKIPDAPHNAQYLGLFEATLDGSYLGLDLNWLQHGGIEGYFARAQTNIIGRLAFAWQTKGLSFYENAEVLELLRRAYLAVADHITPEGKFVWPKDRDMYWAGSHEHAWRLEPLLVGYVWAGDAFPEADRATIEAALRRAADWLIANPCVEHNNRGAVWCAIATLCGLYYADKAMLAAVAPHAQAIMQGVILDDGEIGEHTAQYAGGGPCTNYTYTGLCYVYLYRLFSGDDGMDELLHRAGRWLSLYNTRSGYPIAAGASVRVPKPDPVLADALPFWEWLSHSEPFFARVAERYLETITASGGEIGKHIVSPVIWAMLARGVFPGPVSAWHRDWTAVYRRPVVHYALIGRQYQTGITFRARPGPYRDIPERGVSLRGLQTFAFGDEPPIVFHGRKIASTTQAGKIDTAGCDVSGGEDGPEVLLAQQNSLAVLCERRERLWALYAFTPVSTVVVYGGVDAELRSFWSLYAMGNADLALDRDRRVVAFARRRGHVYYLQGNVSLYDHTEQGDTRWILDVIARPPISAFAFAEAAFAFGAHTETSVAFSDRSGGYVLDLCGMVTAPGDLDRRADFRLVKVSDGIDGTF